MKDTIGFIATNHFRVSNQYHSQMSKTLLSNDESEVEEENKQVKIPKVLHKQEEDKEFIILHICKSEIDKAIGDLKEHKKINQHYQPDYKLIVERYTDKILDVYGWYESLKKTIITTDKTLNVYDEL
jgi:ribosomal protein S4